jgi:hypothetical protein
MSKSIRFDTMSDKELVLWLYQFRVAEATWNDLLKRSLFSLHPPFRDQCEKSISMHKANAEAVEAEIERRKSKKVSAT